MGFKKTILKNYCDDDGMGFKIPCNRISKRKENSKKVANVGRRQQFQNKSFDIRSRGQTSPDVERLASELVSNDKQIITKKHEKKLNRTRRLQRLEKYDSNSTGSSEDTNDDINSLDDRKPSPTSPLKLWKSNQNHTPVKTPLKFPVILDKSNHEEGIQTSPFSKFLPPDILSPLKYPQLSPEELKGVKQSVKEVGHPDLQLSILSICAEMIYEYLFPANDKGRGFPSERRWDDADSEDEEGDYDFQLVQVNKPWFIELFTDIVNYTSVAQTFIDAVKLEYESMSEDNFINKPNLFSFIDSKKVVRHFIYSSSFFASSVVSGMVFEDDRVISSRLSITQAIYRLHDWGIQKPILITLYHTVVSRLERCLAAESVAKSNEVDVNRVASHNLLSEMTGNVNAVNQSIKACNNTIIVPANATEESPSIRVSDHIFTLIQLYKSIISFEEKSFYVSENFESKAETLIKIIVAMFRNYGYSLGSTSDTVENLPLLNCLKTSLSLLVHYFQGHQNVDKYLDFILKEFLRYWPKFSYASEIAFADALACVLLAHDLSIESTNRLKTVKNPSSSLDLCLPRIASYPERAVAKLLTSTTSPHFKVAQRVILSLQSRTLLERYFLSNDEDSSATQAVKEIFLETLVGNLRKNRSHWHPLVQSAASATFDLVFQHFT